MVNGNSGETDGKEDRGLIKGLQGLGMKKVSLFLSLIPPKCNADARAIGCALPPNRQ